VKSACTGLIEYAYLSYSRYSDNYIMIQPNTAGTSNPMLTSVLLVALALSPLLILSYCGWEYWIQLPNPNPPPRGSGLVVGPCRSTNFLDHLATMQLYERYIVRPAPHISRGCLPKDVSYREQSTNKGEMENFRRTECYCERTRAFTYGENKLGALDLNVTTLDWRRWVIKWVGWYRVNPLLIPPT
jgi:hypothetical protein